MSLYVLVWPCMAMHGLFMVLYDLLWQNIVFSRGHRSKFIWSCFWSSIKLWHISIYPLFGNLGTAQCRQNIKEISIFSNLFWDFVWKLCSPCVQISRFWWFFICISFEQWHAIFYYKTYHATMSYWKIVKIRNKQDLKP